jgi:hypothetical protein
LICGNWLMKQVIGAFRSKINSDRTHRIASLFDRFWKEIGESTAPCYFCAREFFQAKLVAITDDKERETKSD